MSFSKSVSLLALGVSLTATSTWAEISASDVWADWQGYMTSMGYTVTGTTEQSGSTLTVRGVEMTQTIPEDNVTVSFEFGELTFTEAADGSVTVAMPDAVPLVMEAAPEGAAPFAMRVDVTQARPVLIVSGDPGDLTYTYSAGTLGFVLKSLEAEGARLTPGQVEASAQMREVSAVTRMTSGTMRSYSQQLTAAALRYDVDLDIPGPDGMVGTFGGGAEALVAQSDGTLPADADPTNLSAMLAGGAGGSGRLSYAAGTSGFDITSPDGPSSGRSTTGATDMTFAMQPDGLQIEVTQSDLDMTMQAANLPLPIELTMARSGFNLGLPVTPSDDPQDFALGLSLADFTISDVIWGMFDPAGQLPRDPITLTMDFTGKALLLLDVFDPDVAARMEENATVPGQLESLTINRIFLSALGAMVAGEGAFSFDNTDMETFQGAPRPEGTLRVTFEGLNALMDTLVTMGLLPQDQAMAGRMMMGLFTVPDGEDRLKSTIEINDEGHVLANGQRLR